MKEEATQRSRKGRKTCPHEKSPRFTHMAARIAAWTQPSPQPDTRNKDKFNYKKKSEPGMRAQQRNPADTD